MQLGKAIILILLAAIQQSCLALYIKSAEKNPAKTGPKDDWGVFKNTLGLSQEKGGLRLRLKLILNSSLTLSLFPLQLNC